MRVLVTGAAGFIGSHVAAALVERGHEVHAVVRSAERAWRLRETELDLTLWEADLADRQDIEHVVSGVDAEAIVHMAWFTQPGRYLTDQPRNLASLAASAQLLGTLLGTGCRRVLLAGTCLEGGTPQPFYGLAKRALHDLGMALTTENFAVACGHIFSVYGPGENEDRAVPSITRSLLRGEAVQVTAASQERDYLHVADVASALCVILEAAAVGQVDVCAGERRPLRDVFEQIAKETGGEHLLRWGARAVAPAEMFEVVGDPARLAGLGWKPAYTLATGIHQTVTWWRGRSG